MRIIDSHAYVGPSLFGQSRRVEDLLHLMDAGEVELAVLAPNRPREYHLDPANQLVAEAVRAHPDRFMGWIRVDPWQKQEALDSLRRGREELGLHGLLLHPWEEQFQVSSAMVDRLVSYAAEQGLPVLIEAGYPLLSHPLDIAELARRHKQTTFIATHGLQLDSSAFALTDAELAMRECENLVMETSGMYAPEVMEKIVHDLGVSRLIFGSHSPWLDFRFEIERVRCLHLMDDEIEAVFAGNISNLMNQKAPAR